MTLELERQMLKAICLQKSQRSTEARSTVEQGLVQFSTQPPLMLLQAWIMWSNGQLNEAMAALNQPALSGLTGKYFLQGKICQQQKRVDCVGQNFGYLLKIAPDSPFFNFGMAWYLVERDDRQRAFDVIATGLRFSPPYVPLLELRDQLEAR